MAVIDPRDELLLRAIGGSVAQVLHRIVDHRAVFSGRTRGRNGAWRLEPTSWGWSDLRRRGKSIMTKSRPEVVLRSDIKQYYGSCSAGVIAEALLGFGLKGDLVKAVETRLERWAEDGVSGLPIGPEFSSVIGTGLLIGLDKILSEHPAIPGHLRYTDDLFVPLRSHDSLSEVVELLRATLSALGLKINWAKTKELPPSTAMEEFDRGLIDYMRDDLEVAAAETLDRLLEIVASYKGDPDQDLRPVQFGLSVMKRRHYSDAVPVVLASDALLEILPKPSADLLLSIVPPIGDQLIEKTMMSLQQEARDCSAARDLHLIRSIENEQLGKPEGDILLGTALDMKRPSPTRSWALVAAAKTKAVSDRDLSDLAMLDGDVLVRRAAVIGFKNRSSRERDLFLADQQVRSSDIRFAAAWVEAA